MDSIKTNNSFSEEQLRQIREKLIKTFLPTFKRQWQSVSRKKDKFINRYDCYLKKNFTVTFNSPSKSSLETDTELTVN